MDNNVLFNGLVAFPYDFASENCTTKASLVLWCVQFALALIWPFIFFNIDKTVAFVINCFLTATVVALITLNFAVNKTSAWLLVPYVLWLIFASLQTLAIIILNA